MVVSTMFKSFQESLTCIFLIPRRVGKAYLETVSRVPFRDLPHRAGP
jgi:hypothetical protein